MNAFEIELTRLFLWYAALSIASFIATMFCLYIVIKSAIRDGIQESGLVDRWKATYIAAKAKGLPEMRTD